MRRYSQENKIIIWLGAGRYSNLIQTVLEALDVLSWLSELFSVLMISKGVPFYIFVRQIVTVGSHKSYLSLPLPPEYAPNRFFMINW